LRPSNSGINQNTFFHRAPFFLSVMPHVLAYTKHVPSAHDVVAAIF
jgi:hypothetical protein